LRLFNAYERAKQQAITLIKAIPSFFSVGFFFAFFFLTYAIFGLLLVH